MYLISSVLKRGLPQSIAITNYSRALSDAQCSLNFIRLLRVVVTPSLTSESTGRQCRPVTSLDGIDDRSIQMLRAENDSKQSDEFQAMPSAKQGN